MAAYFLQVHIPKLFQNVILSLALNCWLPSPSRSYPSRAWGAAQEQLRQGHKEKNQEQQCHVNSSLCCGSSGDATALGHWPKQHLPCGDWQTPHISSPNSEHQQLHLPKCNVRVCGWWYQLMFTTETESLWPEYCKQAWGSSSLKGKLLSFC